MGNSALYGIGCIPSRFKDSEVRAFCGGGKTGQACVEGKKDRNKCADSYASGPPWVIHRTDAEQVFGVWTNTAILVNELWPDLFAEQASFGISQMQFGVKSRTDAYWFLSSTNDHYQENLWKLVQKSSYNPCAERAPPSPDDDFPILWHYCLSYTIPWFNRTKYNLHKDHIHKDILDCDAPLLLYPPRDI